MRLGKIGQALLVLGLCGGAFGMSAQAASSLYLPSSNSGGQLQGDAEFSDAARYGNTGNAFDDYNRSNNSNSGYQGGGYQSGGYNGSNSSNSNTGNAFDDYNRGNRDGGYQGGGYQGGGYQSGGYNSSNSNSSSGNAFDDYNRGNSDGGYRSGGYQGNGYNRSSNGSGNVFDDYNRSNNSNSGYQGGGYQSGGYNSNSNSSSGNAFDEYNRGNSDGGYQGGGYQGGGYNSNTNSGYQGYQGYQGYNSNANYPRMGDFLIYSEDTREGREAISALQDELMSNYGRNITMGSILSRYSYCVNGTKGFYYRPTTQVGTDSVSFRCEISLTPQQTMFMQRGKMSQQLRYMLAEASLGGSYADLASKPDSQRRAEQIAKMDNRTQRRFEWFDNTFQACMQPRSATVEFEFFRSPTNPKNFPNYRAGLLVNFADGVTGYSEFLGEEDGVEFDDLLALYRNKDLISAMHEDTTKGLSLGILLFKAYTNNLNKN